MNKIELMSMIDELGHLKAKIADLTKRERSLKDDLIAEVGPGNSVEGDLFRCTVVESRREKLDMVAVRKKLSAQFLRAHTTLTVQVRVNVFGRVRDAA